MLYSFFLRDYIGHLGVHIVDVGLVDRRTPVAASGADNLLNLLQRCQSL